MRCAERVSAVREYPPSVIVHSPDCVDVRGRILARLPRADIIAQHPNGKPHHGCLTASAMVGVIEPIEYPPHDYEPSSQQPDDASKPLCSYCGGTHGVLDALILPPHSR
jgi:hypothetical protein